MATAVSNLELEVLIGLLACLNLQRHRLAAGIEFATGAFVQREDGINEIAPVRYQPLHGICVVGRFFAAGQRQLQGALRLVALLSKTDERVGEDSGHGFVVAGTTCVEKAILFHQFERVTFPVGAVGFHHIHVCQQQQRLQSEVLATVHRHQATIIRVAGYVHHLGVCGREAGGEQARAHGSGRFSAFTRGQRGLHFHQFLVETAEGRLSCGGVSGWLGRSVR